MLRNIALMAVIFIALSVIPASGSVTTRDSIFTILPEDCRVPAGEELSLELEGPLPSNAVIIWSVDYGSVASVLPGSSAVLVAPAKPSVITVYATISDTRPGRWIYVTRQCIVSPPDTIAG